MRDYSKSVETTFSCMENIGIPLSEDQKDYLAGSVAARLRMEYEAGQRDMRDTILAMCDHEGYGWPAEMIRGIKLESEL